MSTLAPKRLYVDTNIFIYFGERHPGFGPAADRLFRAAYAGDLSLVTSELTLAEALVLPFKHDHQASQTFYLEALTPRAYLDVVPVSRDIIVASAKLRALHDNSLPDAIHIATALATACQAFVTEDSRVKAPSELKVVALAEIDGLSPSGST